MNFTDPEFLFAFFPLAGFLFYGLTPRCGKSFGLGILLVLSLLFYATWSRFYLLLLFCSITVNFLAAYLMLRQPRETLGRRLLLAIGLAYNFGALFWFKYHANSRVVAFSLTNAAIPIGISFYTFQQAIFLIDAYYRDASIGTYLGEMRNLGATLRGYVRHAFFVAFFPHLLIGPIMYVKEFAPQVQSSEFGKFKVRNLEVGLTLLAVGLFKKIVLADGLAPMVNAAFEAARTSAPLPASVAWLGAAAFYAQLYFDFSGYSDMAIGMARALGIRFPINFYSPLKATSIVDFWRRWHMTLTRAIARFLYIPLSLAGTRAAQSWKLRKGPARVFALWLPLLLNFEAIALWHGAQHTFMMFGFVHAIWYISDSELRKTRAWKNWRASTSEGLRAFLGRGLLFLPMMLTFALFRSANIRSFLYLVRHMVSGTGATAQTVAAAMDNVGLLAAAYGVLWLLPNSVEFLRLYRPGLYTYENPAYGWKGFRLAWRPSWSWALLVGGMTISSLYYITRQVPFLYLGF